ncbi:MAG: metallophosphoesterase [Cephaloticoccus sp.]|nr:metallophosphoesterase [Cephaloticoccus sp.]MCF7760176.1 metallophosphoesterase [Cephaloticoccus sp.]
MASSSFQPLRFAVINDLHAQFAPKPSQPGYPGANERAEWMLAQFSSGGALAGMDFVVGAGDLIHGEDLRSITAELKAMRQRLKQLTVPFYPCCGNHEIRQAEGNPAYEAPYWQTYGKDRFDYAISAGAAEIIVLNNAGTFHVTAKRREQRFDRLKHMLGARPGVPKIVVCHVPLVAIRDRDILHRSFGFLSYRCLETEILDLIDTHGADVRLVVSGHLHISGMVKRHGVAHLVTAGTASFPHDYAMITVTSRTVAVEVGSLPRPLHNPASNIHGPPRYTRGFTDPKHQTPRTYLRGNPSERKFTVPI